MPAEKTNWSVPIAIIIAGLLIAGAVLYRGPSQQAPDPNADLNLKAMRAVDAKVDHIRGQVNAPVTIIEYSDLECPFCKRYHDTMNEVFAKYGNNQVAWVYRHLPLDRIHPKAREEAAASECAAKLGGNDAFWSYIDEIFAITPSNNGLDLAELPRIAQKIGLDVEAFNECLEDPAIAKKVEADYQNAVSIGAQGTPFPIIITKTPVKAEVLTKFAKVIETTNKEKTMIVLKGALPFSAINQLISDILK